MAYLDIDLLGPIKSAFLVNIINYVIIHKINQESRWQ
jgi:hypothetical protein